MLRRLIRGFSDLVMCEQYFGAIALVFDTDLTTARSDTPLIEYRRPRIRYPREEDVGGNGVGEILFLPFEHHIIGLTWYTDAFVNTCGIDNFLTAWIRMVRQSHGMIMEKISLVDRCGLALTEIGNHVLTYGNDMSHDLVKWMWIKMVLIETGDAELLNRTPINCMGNVVYEIGRASCRERV